MIVFACNDLIFATKIRSTAEVLGVPARPARNLDMLRARLQRIDDGKGHDPVSCVMVDLELGEAAFELIKAAAAWGGQLDAADQGGSESVQPDDSGTPPTVIAFGPHVMTSALAGAERVGADLVLARGAFTSRLPELISEYGDA